MNDHGGDHKNKNKVPVPILVPLILGVFIKALAEFIVTSILPVARVSLKATMSSVRMQHAPPKKLPEPP